MILRFDSSSVSDYRKFIAARKLPIYRIKGKTCEFPDDYAHLLGIDKRANGKTSSYKPSPFLFDYQSAIAELAIRKRKYAVFADPGLGKTLIMLEFARHVEKQLKNRPILIVSPLMVVEQTSDECQRFYGTGIEQVHARDLQSFLSKGSGIGITNYEALTQDLDRGNLGSLIVDESSMLKSHYGKWGTRIIELGRGLEWKLALTGTPAPNDRIEYANHAVFLDACRTTNEFLAKYFVNRGQTDNRWELKPHALEPFYRDLSHWCIFLSDPSVYGWEDNCGTLPPIRVHIESVELSEEQSEIVRLETGNLFACNTGGIVKRAKLGQLAKGRHNGRDVATYKPEYIKRRVESWPDESTIIWCLYNDEQERLAKLFPEAANISGDTPYEVRRDLIEDFKSGKRRQLITKPKILGFGLNLQVATRQVFSGLQDSFEQFYQAVKRSNRVGSTKPLNVHIPVTDIELPMVDTVLRKAHRVDEDTKEQERIFRRSMVA